MQAQPTIAPLELVPLPAPTTLARRIIDRALDITVFATIFLAATAYQPGDGSYVERMLYPKTRVSAFGVLASVVLLLMVRRRRLLPSAELRRWAGFGMGAIAMLMLAVACSPDPLVRGLLWTRVYLCTFGLFCVTLLDERAWSAARLAMLASGAWVAVQLLLEEFGWRLPGIGEGLAAIVAYAPAATFVHRNSAAHVLLAPLLLAVGQVLRERRRGPMTLRLALVALLIGGLAATRCRTVGVACLAGVGALVAGHRAYRRALLARVKPLLVVIALGVSVHAYAPMAKKAEPLLTKIVTTRLNEPNLVARYVLWRFALQQIAHRPLLGIGAGEFSNAWQAAHPDNPLAGGHAHNVWLQVATELGLINCLVLALLVLQIGLAGRRILAGGGLDEATPVAILIAYLFASGADFAVMAAAVNLHVGCVAGRVVHDALEREPA